ncbi:MAG: hypothetical protein FWB80_07635 [Defluviitaleaceae bacterium]|nr:hypothetical protein [Defluviitaleaceae bacterium]
MKDYDEELKIYFSERTPLPYGLREQTFAKLKEAKEAKSNWIWGIIAFDFIISASILYAGWLMFGQGIFMYFVTIIFAMSLVAAVVVTGVRNALVN